MEEWLKQLVHGRAEGRCEYCRRPAWSARVAFPIDHVRAKQHGGTTTADNLALSCPACNEKKGTNRTTFDPLTDAEVAVFNPRRDRWREHFTWVGTTIVGRSPIGRGTVRLLDLNSKLRLRLREAAPGV